MPYCQQNTKGLLENEYILNLRTQQVSFLLEKIAEYRE